MPPRVHNVVSYTGALLVFWGVLGWRAQTVALAQSALAAAGLWSLHFVRRTLESAFVHRYSKPSIGPADYLTEYAYYWGFGAWIAWSVTAAQHATRVSWQIPGLFFVSLGRNRQRACASRAARFA